MSRKQISVTQAKQYLEDILCIDNEKSKKSLKKFMAEAKYGMPDKEAYKISFNAITNYKKYIEKPQQLTGLLRYSNNVFFANHYFTIQARDEVVKISLDCMQHKNGNVRQAARNLIYDTPPYREYLGPNKDKKGFQKYVLNILVRLEDLIKKYEPSKEYHYIEQLPPSPYKTLTLAWHDNATRGIMQAEFEYFERILQKNILPYKYQMPEDEPAELNFTINDWYAEINNYFDYNNLLSINLNLKILENNSKKLLTWALESENFDVKKYLPIILRLSKQLNGSYNLRHLLTEMLVSKTNEQPSHENLKKFEKIIRAMQSIDNNRILKAHNKLPWSKIMISIAQQISWDNNKRAVALASLLQAFVNVHNSIDEIIDIATAERNTVFKELIEKYGQTDIKLKDYTETRQVLHYMVDWLLQLDYLLFSKKDSKKLAALVVGCFQNINPFHRFIDNTALGAYAGWASGSAINSNYTIMNILQDNMADPEIIILPIDEDL